MTDTPSPPPLSPSGPPGPSGRRRWDAWALFWGLILLAVGVYFFLRETVGLALPDIGEFWPLFIIALGAWILLGAIRRGER